MRLSKNQKILIGVVVALVVAAIITTTVILCKKKKDDSDSSKKTDAIKKIDNYRETTIVISFGMFCYGVVVVVGRGLYLFLLLLL